MAKDGIAARTADCKHCGVRFVARRTDRLSYCSRQCSGAARRRIKTRPEPKVVGHCEICGSGLTRRGAKVCRGDCAAERNRRTSRAASAAKKDQAPISCRECGTSFVSAYGTMLRTYCGEDCRRIATKRVARKKGKARLKLVTVESVDPNVVFERCGWRCQECRVSTPRAKRGTYHPQAPELDHIHPLSLGGEHSYRNTQLLCRSCNARKSNGPGGQLRLFG
jgi:5-methylcytosine-specific restriction endonuclease McrA